MKNRFALLEAIGLAILLTAWVMDWMYVGRISDAASRLEYSLSSAQAAFVAVDLKDTIQLEAAVTRACSSQGLAESPQTNYAVALGSAEVREAWAELTSTEIQYLKNLLLVVQTSQVKYRLPKTTALAVEHVRTLESKFESIKEQLGAVDGATAVPSPTQLGEPGLRSQIQAGQREIVALMNATSEGLAQKASRLSLAYQILFMFGSAGVVLAKLSEWWSSRNSRGRQRRPPANGNSTEQAPDIEGQQNWE